MTTIGKYGSGTTRSKIPIGSYYGHSYILPWEWSPKPEHHVSPTTSSVACQLDLPTQSQLLTHLGSFMSLLEDIQVLHYRKIITIRTPEKIAVITLKIEQGGFTNRICPKDVDWMANSVDPDQNAPRSSLIRAYTDWPRSVCPKN